MPEDKTKGSGNLKNDTKKIGGASLSPEVFVLAFVGGTVLLCLIFFISTLAFLLIFLLILTLWGAGRYFYLKRNNQTDSVFTAKQIMIVLVIIIFVVLAKYGIFLFQQNQQRFVPSYQFSETQKLLL